MAIQQSGHHSLRRLKLEELLERTSIRDNGSEPANQATISPLPILRSIPGTQASLRILNPRHSILLLTPWVPPLQSATTATEKPRTGHQAEALMDPFEHLGRAITTHYHHNVQHVPYVASRGGLSEYHQRFLAQKRLAAVIVVIVSPDSLPQPFTVPTTTATAATAAATGGAQHAGVEPLAAQKLFARDALLYQSAIAASRGREPVPTVLVAVNGRGERRRSWWDGEGMEGFGVVVGAESYAPGVLGRVADAVFEG